MEEDKKQKPEGKRQKAEMPAMVEKRIAPSAVYFTPESWNGVKTVFKCATCGTFRDERDAMIEHILLHYPRGEQEAIFEKLMKET